MPFQPGNKLGFGKPGVCGRKPRIDEAELGDVLSCWKMKDRRTAIRKLGEMASGGHVEAFKALMSYAYGKPRQQIEHSGGLEIGHYNSWNDLREHCESLGIDPWLARQEVLRLIESADDE